MESVERVSTWLEFAFAPLRQQARVRLHPVSGQRNGCFALSLDSRWLHAGDGRLTLFEGLGAALHFLKVTRVKDFEPGEPVPDSLCRDSSQYCLCVDRQKGLKNCTRNCPAAARLDS
ncbi:hypothetical protein C7389_12154 [Azoarcus indigens]|uniref:Uncharacterized protein n=1 Tax=Azoarcus indigens TaxID=29545 RepID=A0A4R6DRX6_9RHOO|nr:hypothetical protein C7389_12154 [Azoarcus indigens]